MTIRKPERELLAIVVLPLLITAPGDTSTLAQGHGPALAAGASPTELAPLDVRRGLPSLPLAFVENAGQWDSPARFVAKGNGMVLRLEPGALALDLRGAPSRRALVRLGFEGCSPQAALQGEAPLATAYSFFLGKDPARWRSGLRGYSSVVYRDLYPGVDIRVRQGAGNAFEYDLLLAKGALLDRVTLCVEGALSMRVHHSGALLLETAAGTLTQPAPIAWQVSSQGARRELGCAYHLLDDQRFALSVHGRDPASSLVIDPGLIWSTYLGGTLADTVGALAMDSAGAVTVAGATASMDFPTTPGAVDPSYNGGSRDAFVARLAASGASLVYATYFGGTGDDLAYALALDVPGNAIVVGWSTSPDLPASPNAFDPSPNGAIDAFAARISAAGTSLHWATYLGGASDDYALGVALDGSGLVAVAGTTMSADFPTTPGSFDPSYNGAGDAFLARLAPDGRTLVSSTFLGGSRPDGAAALAIDPWGNAILSGTTSSGVGSSMTFPVTPGTFQSLPGGLTDAYVAKLDVQGHLLYSTYLGGSGAETGLAIAVDGTGAASVTGTTWSLDFPVTAGAYDTSPNGQQDAFLVRLAPSGRNLEYGSYLGGRTLDLPWGIAVDASGGATLVGNSGSPDFPTTLGCLAPSMNPGGTVPMDGFMARLAPSGGTLLYSTFFGGSDGDSISSIALDDASIATVLGQTASLDLPTTPAAFAPTYRGGASDAFVTRLDLLPTGTRLIGRATPGCRFPPAIGVSSMPQVGNAGFSITCSGAPSSVSGSVLLGASSLSSPITSFGFELWVALNGAWLVAMDIATDARGWAELALPIPAAPWLAGQRLGAQMVWPVPGCPQSGVAASNAIDITVQP